MDLLSCDNHLVSWLPRAPSSRSNEGSHIKVLIFHLLLVIEVMDMKPTYKKSWAGILLMWSYLT